MSLHVSANIHAFILASQYLSFGIALHRVVKSPSSLIDDLQGPEGEPHAPPKVLGMFPQWVAAEAS